MTISPVLVAWHGRKGELREPRGRRTSPYVAASAGAAGLLTKSPVVIRAVGSTRRPKCLGDGLAKPTYSWGSTHRVGRFLRAPRAYCCREDRTATLFIAFFQRTTRLAATIAIVGAPIACSSSTSSHPSSTIGASRGSADCASPLSATWGAPGLSTDSAPSTAPRATSDSCKSADPNSACSSQASADARRQRPAALTARPAWLPTALRAIGVGASSSGGATSGGGQAAAARAHVERGGAPRFARGHGSSGSGP